MPFSPLEHIENLTRHIDLVRAACLLLGKRLIAQGEVDFGVALIARGYKHDFSKFFGIEWEGLHVGKDTPKRLLEIAIKQHTLTNDHHPEAHLGFENMPRICVAEMAADIYARSQEFGTCLRDWIENEAIKRYKIDKKGQQYKWLISFVDILLEDSFKR